MRLQAAKSMGGLLLCLGVALVWTSAQLHWHPSAEHGFIFRDAGHVLTLADELLNGRMLYRDIFYQYGPVSAWFYASIAAVFGNSPATLLTLQQVLSLVVAALAYRLLRSALPQTQTILFLIVGLFPLLLLPGSSLADFSGLDYVSWERILLLAIALAWKPPQERTGWYAVTQGGLLGSLQLVKFGSAFIAGAALLLVDLLYLKEFATDRSSRRKWLIINLTLLAAFAVVEGGLIMVAFGLLPNQIAWDTIWPYFMLQSYASYVIGAERWPIWQNMGYFVVAQLPAITALLLIGYSAFRHARRSTVSSVVAGDRSFGGFAFLAAFFLIGLTIYFQHVWHIYQYLWTIMLAAGWGIRYARLPFQAALLAIWLPAFLVSARAVLPRRPTPELVLETFPNGDRLWLETKVQAQLATLREYLLTRRSAASGDLKIMLFPDAGGLHHFFESPPRTRFFWFTGGLVQKNDEAQFLEDFSALDAVVVFFKHPRNIPPGSDPVGWSRELFSMPAFGSELNGAMRSVLADPVRIDDHCWVFPVERSRPGPEMRTREDSNFKPSDP